MGRSNTEARRTSDSGNKPKPKPKEGISDNIKKANDAVRPYIDTAEGWISSVTTGMLDMMPSLSSGDGEEKRTYNKSTRSKEPARNKQADDAERAGLLTEGQLTDTAERIMGRQGRLDAAEANAERKKKPK